MCHVVAFCGEFVIADTDTHDSGGRMRTGFMFRPLCLVLPKETCHGVLSLCQENDTEQISRSTEYRPCTEHFPALPRPHVYAKYLSRGRLGVLY